MGGQVQDSVKCYKPNTKKDGCKLYPLPLVTGTSKFSDPWRPRLLIFFSLKKNVDELTKSKFYSMLYILYMLFIREIEVKINSNLTNLYFTNYTEIFQYILNIEENFIRYSSDEILYLSFFDTLFTLSPMRWLLLKINGKDINSGDIPFIGSTQKTSVTVDISKIFNLLDTLISEQCLYNDRELTKEYLSQYTMIDPATRENSPGSTPDKMVVETPSAKGSSETVFGLPKGGTRHRNKRSTRRHRNKRTRRQTRTK
jgi:hypothetical protein